MNEQDFLAAITDSPDDEVPRLVYADWLDEQGDPRGEFIRVQCQRAKLEARDPRCLELDFRERSLLADYRNHWAKEVRKWGRVIQYRRGFVEDITVQASKFLESGQELLAVAPIRRVKLMKAKPHLKQLAECKLLERLRHLNLRDSNLGLRPLREFLKSSWTSRLEGWDFSFNGWGPSALREFAKCKTIGPLKHLALSGCKIESDSLGVLLDSERVGSLEALELASNQLTDHDMKTLAASTSLGQLKSLGLEQNSDVQNEGVYELLSSESLSSLRDLSLRGCSCGRDEENHPAFPKESPLEQLVSLDLEGLFWPKGHRVEQLGSTSWVDRLVHVNVSHNYVGLNAFSALLKPGRLPFLRTLNLSWNQLRHKVVEKLIEMGTENLTDLNLAGNEIGNEGAQVLAESVNFANLNILNLRGNGITDSGARVLAKSETLNRITELRMTMQGSDYGWNKSEGISDEVKKLLIDRFGRHVCYFD